MKNLLIICSILFSFLVNAQQGYPVPPKSENRLFYIQHNDNRNTFVYDALFSSKGILDANNPVDIYRILYAEDGSKKPLTSIQKKISLRIRDHKKGKECLPVKFSVISNSKINLKA